MHPWNLSGHGTRVPPALNPPTAIAQSPSRSVLSVARSPGSGRPLHVGHTGDTEWAKVRFHPQAQEDQFQDLAHNTAFHMCAFYAQSTNQPLELLDFFLGPLYAGNPINLQLAWAAPGTPKDLYVRRRSSTVRPSSAPPGGLPTALAT